jgi:DNA recombination protein RmuC
MKKLYSGRGNLVSSVEKIKKLGAKATKSLPQSLLDRVDDSDEDEENFSDDRNNDEETLFQKDG